VSGHRYVDGTFVIMEPETKIQDILDVLNSFHPPIKFTYEVKSDNSLPFLDVRVCRSPSNDVATTIIYRKPIFTGLMTYWNSFVPFYLREGKRCEYDPTVSVPLFYSLTARHRVERDQVLQSLDWLSTWFRRHTHRHWSDEIP
jgi:hypothetical protein